MLLLHFQQVLFFNFCIQQFDPVIEAAKCGQDVDLSKMPPSLKASGK